MTRRSWLRLVAVLALLGPAPPMQAVERALDKSVTVDAPLDAVWASWTTRDGIVGFFAPDAEIDARVDGAFHVFINPYAAPGLKGADTMRFLALQPKRMLSFDWNAPPSLPAVRGQHTVVVLRFLPEGATTRVTLHHTGWGEPDGADGGQWDAAYRYFDKAWDTVLGNLQKRHAAGGGPMDWTSWLEQMRKASAQ